MHARDGLYALVLVSALTLFNNPAAAQSGERPVNERTTPAPDGRFEILQSALAARITLRVDRFTGITDQLVERPDSALSWRPMLRLSHRDPDTRVVGRANYQVFTSGIEAKLTFMININSGATWQLKEDPKEGWFWDPIG